MHQFSQLSNCWNLKSSKLQVCRISTLLFSVMRFNIANAFQRNEKGEMVTYELLLQRSDTRRFGKPAAIVTQKYDFFLMGFVDPDKTETIFPPWWPPWLSLVLPTRRGPSRCTPARMRAVISQNENKIGIFFFFWVSNDCCFKEKRLSILKRANSALLEAKFSTFKGNI